MERIHIITVQKDLNEPDYYDGVITHQEPDILESKVKWALGHSAVLFIYLFFHLFLLVGS